MKLFGKKYCNGTIEYWCASHIGNVRRINQDNISYDGKFLKPTHKNIFVKGKKKLDRNILFGVFDGIGGGEFGELASYIAARKASELRMNNDVPLVLSNFCKNVNKDICDYAKSNDISSMGTTAALLVFAKDEIVLCNIGDSKIFRINNGNIEQISNDHVEISPYGMKPLLSQYLGISSDELIIEPYLARGKYNNDIYIICSDGLTDMLTKDEIIEIVNTNNCENIINKLLEKALEKGGKDNISIIVCNVQYKINMQ